MGESMDVAKAQMHMRWRNKAVAKSERKNKGERDRVKASKNNKLSLHHVEKIFVSLCLG